MTPEEELALRHLAALVAVPSTNPPRRADRIVALLRDTLPPGFDVRVTDLGDGCVALLAVRGRPSVVFNVHVDTVPVVPGWTHEPFQLTVVGDKAYGLGACDAKGAAASLLAALASWDGPAALLFTTDEEAGQARCARWFASEPRGFSAVIVGEPTGNRVISSHRGVATARVTFEGRAGHSSERRASANHALVAWAGRALAFAEDAAGRGRDLRLNLGRIEGGEKPNVVAARAEVRFGVRPPPGESPREVMASLLALAPEGATQALSFVGEPLVGRPESADLVARWRVDEGGPVDFWTEAPIFAEAVPALVYGPGSIAQAHSADEFVDVASLGKAAIDYRRALSTFAELAP